MFTLQEVHEQVGGELRGDATVSLTGVNSLSDAGATELAPFDNAGYIRSARSTAAGAVLVTPNLAHEVETNAIVHDFPVAAMNVVIEMLGQGPRRPTAGVHPTAVIDPSTKLPEDVSVGPFAVIGAPVRVGSGCVIGPHVVLEGGVRMGDDCTLEAGAVLHEGTELGNDVVIGTGAVIARPGFGFTPSPTGPLHIHHVGRVVVGDKSHVGAYCSIDRARFGVTRVGSMSGLDYGIHVGHNARIGNRSFMAAQSGMAGHAFVGDDCEIGGQAGFANHAGVGNRCRVGAKSGLNKDFGDDRTLFGVLAVDYAQSMRMEATLRRLAQRPTKRGGPRKDDR
ncbi:MAG: UDP-3-O-(3-hydroxymyristoyl)glucosamine N-acyltransferase [Planctomycetota bacterium]|jgi:UDP-3-O-[3-hydroxymyristoyl] glucosamine N-acyltransferase